jgi:hypothetical protein
VGFSPTANGCRISLRVSAAVSPAGTCTRPDRRIILCPVVRLFGVQASATPAAVKAEGGANGRTNCQ